MTVHMVTQRSHKKGQALCGKRKFYSRDEVKAEIQSLKAKRINGQPIAGSSTLISVKCHKCTSKKGEVFHIAHFNRKRING